MTCFFKGALGALAVLICAAIVVPQYSDYRAAAETSRWLAQMDPVRLAIEQNAMLLKTMAGAGKYIDVPASLLSPPPGATLLEIRDSGEIILHGGSDGQLVILTPSFAEGKVTWRCLGGSAKDVHCGALAWISGNAA
jgi:hypothetical protein